jgi:hypothetical protein
MASQRQCADSSAEPEMQDFHVVVPANVKPGQQFCARIGTDGPLMNVFCPENCGPGTTLQVRLPKVALPRPKNLPNPQSASKITVRLASALYVPTRGDAVLVMCKKMATQQQLHKVPARPYQGRVQEARTADHGVQVDGRETQSVTMRTSGALGMAPTLTQSPFGRILICMHTRATRA